MMAMDSLMQVNVLFFALVADRIGRQSQTLTLAERATVSDALDALEQAHPELAPLRKGLATAVDMAYVKAEHILKDGDELALIPPVSGG